MRGKLAFLLVGILGGLLVAAFALMFWIFYAALFTTKCDKDCAERIADLLMKVLGLVFTPVVALVGSALGFYYGTQPAKGDKPAGKT